MDKKIFTILLLGFALRVTAINFGLPALYHADEPIVVNHALAFGSGDLNPHFFKIPPLTSYLLFVCYGIFFAAGKILGAFQNTLDFENLFYSNPSSFYLIARVIFGAFLGTATLGVFYRSVKKHFGSLQAETATFFFCVYFLHVRDSHYVYADIPLLLVIAAGFFKIWDYADKPSMKNLVSAAFLVGLAAAFKYNGLFLAIPFAYILLRHSGERFPVKGAGCAALIAAAVYFVFNPYSILDFRQFAQEMNLQSKSLTGAGWTHHLTYSLAGAAGLPMLTAACFGIFLKLKNKPTTKHLSLIIFGVSYYALLALKGQHYDRYVLPLTPVIVFFASEFTISMAEFAGKWRRAVLVLFLIFLAGPSLVRDALWLKVMSAPDTRDLAHNWVKEHIPAGAAIAGDWDFYMPRLKMSPQQLEQKKAILLKNGTFSEIQKRRMDYLLEESFKNKHYELYDLSLNAETEPAFFTSKPKVPYSISALKEKGIRYVIIGSFSKQLDAARQPFYQDLQEHSRLMAEFSPYRNPEILRPLDTHPLTGGPFLIRDLLSRTRNGQPLKIYDLQ